MATESSEKADWREFERVVARIEAAAGPLNMAVKCPDRVRSLVTGRLREVDASIRMKMGTSDVLITIECRKRKPTQDVTWIEQLATKRQAIGAARTIAVSSNGFSSDAQTAAKFYGIDLRTISELSIESINQFLKIDFVLFTRRNCASPVFARDSSEGKIPIGRSLPSTAWTGPRRKTLILRKKYSPMLKPVGAGLLTISGISCKRRLTHSPASSKTSPGRCGRPASHTPVMSNRERRMELISWEISC